MAEQLKSKRAILKGKLTRFRRKLDELDRNNLTDAIINELNERLERLQPCLDEFDSIQSELELLAPSDLDEGERQEFEDNYYLLVGTAKALCTEYLNRNMQEQESINYDNVSNSNRSNVGSNNVNDQNFSQYNNLSSFVTLPPIKLMTFNGQYSNWREYRDSFKALVDSNNRLQPIQKFYYLRSSLEKDALQVIHSIEVCDENYEIAWRLLEERFENKRLMIHNHIRAIFSYPKIRKESHTELRNLCDTVTKHIRSLKALGEETDSWDRLIIYVLAEKFDDVTRRDWETYKCQSQLPCMSDMNEFLKVKCEVLEKLELTKSEKLGSQGQCYKKRTSSSFVASTSDKHEIQCYYCQQGHTIYKCDKFLSLSVPDRISAVKRLKLCLRCLHSGHVSWRCKSQLCVLCKKSHNKLLHNDSFMTINSSQNNPESTSSVVDDDVNQATNALAVQSVVTNKNSVDSVSISSHSIRANAKAMTSSQVLLSTAIVKIRANNKVIKSKSVLDSGSQSCFISESLCTKLKLKPKRINHVVNGVGQALTNISKQVTVNMVSCYNNFNIDINCLVLPKITEKLPIMSFDKAILNIPTNVNLADPDFNISSDIDLLLGSNVFWSIIRDGQRRLGPNLPILQNSVLGYIVAGDMCFSIGSNYSVNCLSVTDDLINENIQKFWRLEDVNNQGYILSCSEKYCEEQFIETLRRDDSGRFIVKIPFKKTLKMLGSSRETALKRFYLLEKRLNGNSELRNEYVKFMNEYKELNHMTEVTDTDEGYFLPHHAVIKESITTKCRVVFDASCKTDSGLSLNEVQFVGPALTNDIFSILLRFRSYRYVITADISKMYRQILVDECQRKYQKIFWRASSDEPLKCYELNTVTYGTASAPYLAMRCLVQLALDVNSTYPNISTIIKNDFYVDDLLTGANTLTELIDIQNKVSSILSKGGFELRKWLCNDKNTLNEFRVNDNLDLGILHIGEDQSNKTLGIYWNSANDVLQFSIKNAIVKPHVTKREVLSVICSTYDPLGILGPVIVVSKLIIQELWKLKISWDDYIPQNLYEQWRTFQTELSVLNDLRIPRQAIISLYVQIELHGFCDSSERAYGACLYSRCILSNGRYVSNLLCAKSRVAPLKQVSLPRLELCGAVLLANLSRKISDSLRINFGHKYYWTDSMIALAWIRGEPQRWKTFIANRVGEIQSLTDISEWNHVKSEENPADLLSRGVRSKELVESQLWWHGPEWFFVDSSEWNLQDVNLKEIPEMRCTISNTSVNKLSVVSELINNFSTLTKVQRILAYILRFVKNCRLSIEKRFCGALSTSELEDSLAILIRCAQIECYPEEYRALSCGKEINKNSKVLSLNPFIRNSLLHVGGRLDNSKYSFEKKHPILLPTGHRLTQLMLEYEHKRLMHCGAHQLLYSIRERFWPVSGRNMCKKIVRMCVTCFKARPKASEYVMGNLPSVRVDSFLPFLNVGVDYGGPFLIKDRITRGAKYIKAYLCLFVCMSTKAVHLELVSELTSNAFIATLHRFVSRRGKPANIFSDNALNFVGANNELSQIADFLKNNSEAISSNLAQDQINWRFIPANSPTFGGLWEAGIKSTKFHIKRVVGNQKLTFEDFNTVLIKIEGILNSRPLSPLSPNPDDTTALTPAHFLIGRSMVALPERNVMTVPENRLSKFQKLQAMYQHFWARWQKEYVSELQVRSKWKQASQQLLKPGSLVLIKGDNVPPLHWQLGRVTKLYPGDDNVVRVVDVKTATGAVIRRAVTRLCVLPIDSKC